MASEVSERRLVFIPIVAPGAGLGAFQPGRSAALNGARLIEVYSQRYTAGDEERRKLDEKALDKDWDRVAAPLRKIGLYQAGCAAASAVHKLGLKRPRTALYQWLKPQAWIEGQRLHSFSPQGPTEGSSAELGLAVTLLMSAAGAPHRHAFATGVLSHNPGPRTNDVEILPVGRLPEKLDLVIQHLTEQGLPSTPRKRKLLFFTPTHFEQNGVTTPVKDLAGVQELSRLGVEVVPVAWLSEVARTLHAHKSRYLFQDRLLQLLAGGLVLLGLLGAGWSWWRHAPIPLAYLPASPEAAAAEPFEVCFTEHGGYYPLALGQAGVVHTIPVNATLGWKVKVGAADSLAARLGAWLGHAGYYVAQVMIAESSPAKVITPRLSGEDQGVRIPPGHPWEWAWKLSDRAESNGLVLLAQRHAPFDPDELRNRLLRRFPQAGGGGPDRARLDVTAAVNFMSRQAPGAVAFIIRTVEEHSGCTP